jgi:hypothetical protein
MLKLVCFLANLTPTPLWRISLAMFLLTNRVCKLSGEKFLILIHEGNAFDRHTRHTQLRASALLEKLKY